MSENKTVQMFRSGICFVREKGNFLLPNMKKKRKKNNGRDIENSWKSGSALDSAEILESQNFWFGKKAERGHK